MKKLIEKLKAVDKGTLIRSISLVVAILNQVVAVIGASSFANAVWYQILSIVATVVTSVWAAWENNDWTFFARLGTKVLNALEDGKITKEEVEGLFRKDESPKTEGGQDKKDMVK